MAPLHVLLCPPLLQLISQCDNQVRLSFNTPDAEQGEILLNPRASGITSRLFLSPLKQETCPIPPLWEETFSHVHQHTAQELCVGVHGQIAWAGRCPLSIRNLNFLLGFGGKFFWLGKVSRRLFYSIFTSVLLVLPVVGSAPRTQQHAGGKRIRGEKRQTSEAQEPQALLLYRPPACI